VCLPTLSKLYWCHKLHCMHCATDADTIQTVPVPQQALLYPQCHRHRHYPNCTGATASSTVCTVPPTQTLSKLYRCQKLLCMHGATDRDTLQTVPVPQAPLYAQCHRHSRYHKRAHSFFTSRRKCSNDVS